MGGPDRGGGGRRYDSIAPAVVRNWFTAEFAATHPDTVAWARSRSARPRTWATWVLPGDPGLDHERRLGAITAPTLMVCGTADPATRSSRTAPPSPPASPGRGSSGCRPRTAQHRARRRGQHPDRRAPSGIGLSGKWSPRTTCHSQVRPSATVLGCPRLATVTSARRDGSSEPRISDLDRERAAALLASPCRRAGSPHSSSASAARRCGRPHPHRAARVLADLPGGPPPELAPLVLDVAFGQVRRTGQWAVPEIVLITGLGSAPRWTSPTRSSAAPR